MVVASMVAMIAGKDSEMAYCLSSVVLDVASTFFMRSVQRCRLFSLIIKFCL